MMYKTRFATSVHIAKQSGGVSPEITTGQDVTAYSIDYTYIKGQSITGYASSANSGQYPDDALSRNVCLSKRSPSFSLKVHQDQPVQRVFLSITDRERFRHFDKAAA